MRTNRRQAINHFAPERRNAPSTKPLANEQSEQMEEILRESMAHTSQEGAHHGFVVFEHEDAEWIFLEEYYCKMVVARTLKTLGLSSSMSSAIFSSNMPEFIRVDFLIHHFVALAQKVMQEQEDCTYALMAFVGEKLGIKQIWPDSECTVSFYSYFLMLRSCVGQHLIDHNQGIVFKLKSISSYEEMTGLEMYISGEVLMPFGGQALVTGFNLSVPFFADMGLSDLPLVPASKELRMSAGKRGRNLIDILGTAGASYLSCNGQAYRPGFMGSKIAVSVQSRIMADPQGCREVEPQLFEDLLGLYKMRMIDEDNIKLVMPKTDDDFALLTPFFPIYSLTTSEWLMGRSQDLSVIDFAPQIFDQMVLPAQSKRHIKAIVTQGCNSIDFIAGKGAGAVFLLDGEPGTGKTLTAEATAEMLLRPLYKVSLADLGTNIGALEEALTNILRLAERWRAVLLIDEADVFMQKRDNENIERNAMVAVFLRLLEYYSGVLFLTTNRGQDIDEAFLSRLSLALHYSKLSEQSLKAIWEILLTRAGIALQADQLETLAKLNFNGREIKHLIANMISLAAYDEQTPGWDQLNEMIESFTTFRASFNRSAA